MDGRQAVGSWLSGPRAAAESMGVDFGYRGEQLGLPKEGRGSIASVGRRIGALVIDWLMCLLIAYGLFARGESTQTGNWALGIFFVLTLLTVGTVGLTPGKAVMRIRVESIDGGRVSVVRVLARTVLLCLVIPAVVWDRDTRGLHDRVARSVVVRL
ncbi:RDD family protein [Streptomyces boninensis]|uniref:RDD family protein n=1 Tax=Streptomyces boninensis TaxID=2039455 RepID=UPI003B21BE0C